jgi:hypothetical protein
LRGLALKHFFTTLEEEGSIEGYYTDICLREEKVMCALFFSIILPLAKWSLGDQGYHGYFCVFTSTNCYGFIMYKQFFSSLHISNTILRRHQIPYMSIVNKSTPITRLNLENILGHQKALLTIKGHQTSCWKQTRKSMQDAFVEYQENEHLIY